MSRRKSAAPRAQSGATLHRRDDRGFYVWKSGVNVRFTADPPVFGAMLERGDTPL
jgi:hypothetical protein